MKVELWVVGKTKEAWVLAACDHYLKRIGRYCDIDMQVIAESRYKTPTEISKDETSRIMDRLAKHRSAYSILLDETGNIFSSVHFAQQVEKVASTHGAVRFIVGGAYGVESVLHENVDLVMSLSSMTFPHQLVRVVFLEQLYRAFTILRREGYHHE